ncbi:MFS transporter [Pseudomonas sp. RIT-To-2]|uniref:MFS transporter n=1 Tax=Pseudomonas sp. RIT-To-2 TaxID=3462541 RepID=UPI002412F0B3
MTVSIPLAGVKRGTLTLFAVACGVMVANIYLCQPLLAEIARALGAGEDQAGLVAVATQVGYTLGILFVVPLADNSDPVKLVRWLMSLTIAGLIAAFVSPNLAALMLASVCIAATCVVAQVLIPLATTLAGPEYRGRIVSKLSTGLIMGILLSRTFSGLSAQYLGSWRAPFAVEAVLVAVLLFVLPHFIPGRPAKRGMGYWPLLKSLPPLLQHRELQVSMMLSFCTFAGFSAIWATLAFHLSSPAFHLGPAAAGLFGLWGAPGALLAPYAGRLVDRWGPDAVNLVSLLALAASYALAFSMGATGLIPLVIAINLLDFGQQSGQVANQARLFGLSAEIRGRLNTLYMVVTFTGGATGAFVGAKLWTLAGWTGVCCFLAWVIAIAAVILAASHLAPPGKKAGSLN